MGAYAYEAPSNLSDAIALLDDHAKEGKRAQILAGGTDLLGQMRSVDNAPRSIIDVKSWKKLIGWTLVMRFTLVPRYRVLSFTKTKS